MTENNKDVKKHTRNISTVSEISEILDPIKRGDGLDVRVIFLLKSKSDCSDLFKNIKDLIIYNDDTSVASRVTECSIVSTLMWEETHNSGKYTPSLDLSQSAPYGYPASLVSNSKLDAVEDSPSKFFFRFSIDGQVFLLRLVHRETRNELRMLSYDFITVCSEVKSPMGSRSSQLEGEIKDVDWAWVEKNCQQRPTILLGYCLSCCSLEEKQNCCHEECLDLFNDALSQVNKLKSYKKKISAIPKFCEFTLKSVGQIIELFNDMKRLLFDPGYFLQQCALANDLFHFKTILRSPSCTDQVLNYTDNTYDGDNPVMIAAKLRHKHLVSCALSSERFDRGAENSWDLDRFLHSKNKYDQSLLHMVTIQGPELEEQKLHLLRKEIELHCQSELAHEANQLALKRCMRNQLKSSEETTTILSQIDYLQGIPRTEHERKMEKCRVWSGLLFSTLLLSLGFSFVDYGSDGLITYRYFQEAWGDKSQKKESNSNITECCWDWPNQCGESKCSQLNITCDDTLPIYCINEESCINAWNNGQKVPFQCFPESLAPHLKFTYTLLFICLPWPLFLYEFFTSRHYQMILQVNIDVMEELVTCQGFKSMMICYFKLLAVALYFLSCVLLWPIVIHFIKFYNDGMWYLSRNREREKREKKRENSEVLWNTARMMEVSFEASFQPTIQLYLLFPTLFEKYTGNEFSLELFKIHGSDLSTFEYDQTVSIFTSIIGLSWGFLSYHSVLKRGALEKDLTSLFYKAVLYLAILFQILSRLFIFVIFAFSFGPGRYHPLLIFMISHCVLMMVLHYIFSDAKDYWEKGGLAAFFHYLTGNGAANMYIHNWIRMDPFLKKYSNPKQHYSTFCRQFIFDFIFLIENCFLLYISLNSFTQISELQEVKVPYFSVLFGFHVVGMILKCIYYRYIHMWAWLILDYFTLKEDGHWSCILFTNMFFCGKEKTYRLTLCCLPQPVFSVVNAFFGEQEFACTDKKSKCSLCTAVISICLFPIAVVMAIIGFIIAIILFLAFMPFFLTVILPCFFIVKCIKCQHNINKHDQIIYDQNTNDVTVNIELHESENIALSTE